MLYYGVWVDNVNPFFMLRLRSLAVLLLLFRPVPVPAPDPSGQDPLKLLVMEACKHCLLLPVISGI